MASHPHRSVALIRLIAACSLAAPSCSTRPVSPSATPSEGSLRGERDAIVVHDFTHGIVGVRRANPRLELRVTPDSGAGGEPVLTVDYPVATNDPAQRDVYFDVSNRNWSAGSAILLRIKSSEATRLSVSFMDRNHIVYTSWMDLFGGSWQTIRIPFSAIRPNPYFQPPDAKKGVPLDVSDVGTFGLAPQSPSSGRLTISRIVVVK